MKIKNPHTGDERRRWTRHKIHLSITIPIAGPDRIHSYAYGRAINLSQGGLAAFIAGDYEVGGTIELVMSLPCSLRKISCTAVVRNRNGQNYCLEFVNLSSHDRELLMDTSKGHGVAIQP